MKWRFSSSSAAGDQPPAVDDLSFGTPVSVGSPQESWRALVAMHGGASASRAESMTVPGVVRIRNGLCDLAATLPLQTIDPRGNRVSRSLIDQPEAPFGLQRGYSLAWLLDDIFFYGTGCWHVVQHGWDAKPNAVVRVPFGRWSVAPDGTVRIDSEIVDPATMVWFRSTKDPFLKVAAPTIRALLALEAQAARLIAQPAHRAYFQSKGGRKYSPEQIDAYLRQVQHWSTQGVDGWLPPDIQRIEVRQPTAEELQLSKARDYGVQELARLASMTPNQLGVPTVSRTYENAQDERASYLDLVAAPYLKVIEETLSDDTVTPHGYKVRFNYDAFLRTNHTKERYEAYEIAQRIGVLSEAETRELENRPPLGGGPR